MSDVLILNLCAQNNKSLFQKIFDESDDVKNIAHPTLCQLVISPVDPVLWWFTLSAECWRYGDPRNKSVFSADF